jgi:hypothetical protein
VRGIVFWPGSECSELGDLAGCFGGTTEYITFIKYQAIPSDVVQRTLSTTEVGGDRCVCCEHYVFAEQISNVNMLLSSVVSMNGNSSRYEMSADY